MSFCSNSWAIIRNLHHRPLYWTVTNRETKSLFRKHFIEIHTGLQEERKKLDLYDYDIYKKTTSVEKRSYKLYKQSQTFQTWLPF